MLTLASRFVAPSVGASLHSLAARFLRFSTNALTGVRQPSAVAVATFVVSAPPPSPATPSRAAAIQPGALDGIHLYAQPARDWGGTYWPCGRLNAFILQMAAHGRCVSAAMMLGHRHYAVEQLAAARKMPDGALRSLAAELEAYFDAPPDGALQQHAAR